MDSQHSTLINMSDETTKADDLFHLQILTMKAETELVELLESFPPPFNWSDFKYDYYDFSLEIFGVPDTFKLCGEIANKLHDYGFHKVWTHKVNNKEEYTNLKPRRQQGERFYTI